MESPSFTLRENSTSDLSYFLGGLPFRRLPKSFRDKRGDRQLNRGPPHRPNGDFYFDFGAQHALSASERLVRQLVKRIAALVAHTAVFRIVRIELEAGTKEDARHQFAQPAQLAARRFLLRGD